MFTKFGSLTEAQVVTAAEWRKLILASTVHSVPEQMTTVAEFDLDPSNFLYVRARAVSAGEYHGANQNGDFFPEEELKKAYRTFVRRGVYVNHKSDDPAGAIGIILDAVWHDDNRKYVECLLAIDKSEPIAKKIEAGIANSWSMGALVKQCECSVCTKRASSEAEYCDCLRTALGREWNGKKVYAVNRDISFYELSNVTVPADPQAYTLQVMAAKEGDRCAKCDKEIGETVVARRGKVYCSEECAFGKQANLSKKLMDLADEYTRKVAALTKSEDPASAVREKLSKQDSAVATDRQVIGSVRRRLKVATAKLLPREGLSQRVQSALAAGGAQADKQNQPTADNSLEGVIVENNLTIRYIPGKTIAECLFVARKGKLQATVSAEKLLDPKVAREIEAAEKAEIAKSAQKPAEKIKDDTKPSADNTLDESMDGTQPKDKVNELSAKPAKEIKDESKPSADSTMTNGKDPAQPSDVVKRYAQLIGAESVTFKQLASGGFTAHLSSGSISRLATLWGSVPRIVREAKIAGEPMMFAREDVKPEKVDMNGKPHLSREDASKGQAKPQGSLGSEQKSYAQQYNAKNLAEGGEDGWARKFNELSKTASAEIKALKIENDTLRKSLEAVKMAAVEEKKAAFVDSIVSYMEKAGALHVSEAELLDLQERGLSHEDAQVKAFANTVDRKKAELRSLDLKALEAMAKNLSEVAPVIKARASRKDIEIPLPSREDASFADDATRLSQGWD